MRTMAFILLLATHLFATSEPLRVNPEIEGIYQLSTPQYNEQNTLVVMNTLTDRGAVVSIPDPRLGYPRFIFSTTRLQESAGGLTHIESFGFGPEQTDLQLNIDPKRGILVGWLRNPATATDTKLEGRLKYSTARFYQKPSYALPPQYLQGEFQKQDSVPGSLFVHYSLSTPGLWRGRFHYTVGVDSFFEYGHADLRSRVLELVSAWQDNGCFLKWIFSVEVDELNDTTTLKGMGFDTSFGRIYPLTLTRTAKNRK